MAGIFSSSMVSLRWLAQKIGRNCHINQQVTVGYTNHGAPEIGNGVVISAGAIIIGDITIGDNAIIGAGAVVIKSVFANETVAGVAAKRIGFNTENIRFAKQ